MLYKRAKVPDIIHQVRHYNKNEIFQIHSSFYSYGNPQWCSDIIYAGFQIDKTHQLFLLHQLVASISNRLLVIVYYNEMENQLKFQRNERAHWPKRI